MYIPLNSARVCSLPHHLLASERRPVCAILVPLCRPPAASVPTGSQVATQFIYSVTNLVVG